MMSQTNAPIYSRQNGKRKPVLYYSNNFDNLYLGNKTSYCNLKANPVPAFNYLCHLLSQLKSRFERKREREREGEREGER